MSGAAEFLGKLESDAEEMEVLASDGSSAHLLGNLMSSYSVVYEVARCTAAVVQREVAKTQKLFLVRRSCTMSNWRCSKLRILGLADFCHSFRRYHAAQLPLHYLQTSPLLLHGLIQ